MTRIRTHAPLTELAELVASAHGELEFVGELLVNSLPEMARAGLERHRSVLLARREALYLAVKQLDPGLDPSNIAASDAWLKPFGQGRVARKRATRWIAENYAAMASSNEYFARNGLPLARLRGALAEYSDIVLNQIAAARLAEKSLAIDVDIDEL